MGNSVTIKDIEFPPFEDIKKLSSEEQTVMFNKLRNELFVPVSDILIHFGISRAAYYARLKALGFPLSTAGKNPPKSHSKNNVDVKESFGVAKGEANSSSGQGELQYGQLSLQQLVVDTKREADLMARADLENAMQFIQTSDKGFNMGLEDVMSAEDLADELELMAKIVRRKKTHFNVSVNMEAVIPVPARSYT